MKLSQEQRGVAIRMGIGLIIAAIALSGAAWLTVSGDPRPVAERLELGCRMQFITAGWLAVAIANVARLRFFSPEDIAGSSSGLASEPVRVGNAILQNTLEQAVIAGLIQLAASTVWEHPAPLLVAHACLFTTGRALFFLGYRHGAVARALGFALTFYPSVGLLFLVAVKLLSGD